MAFKSRAEHQIGDFLFEQIYKSGMDSAEVIYCTPTVELISPFSPEKFYRVEREPDKREQKEQFLHACAWQISTEMKSNGLSEVEERKKKLDSQKAKTETSVHPLYVVTSQTGDKENLSLMVSR